MGNIGATLSISLDSDNSDVLYATRAGDTVTGKITLQAQKPLKKVSLVHLHIIGQEKGRFKYTQNNYVRAHRDLVRFKMVVYTNSPGTTIAPGVYHYRFSFVLPEVLPTTMMWRERSNVCHIKYKLMATISKERVTRPILETERSLLVAAKPSPDTMVPCFLNPTAHKIKSMGGLLNKGNLLLGVSVKNTHIGRGETLDVCFATRNKSTVSIKEVVIKLIETVRITYCGTPSCCESNDILVEKHIPELGVKKKQKSKAQQVAETLEEDYRNIYNDLLSELFKVNILIPKTARDTYDGGHIIAVSHQLQITYHTKSIHSDPTVSIPLKIGYPPLETSSEAPFAADVIPLPAPIDDDGVPVAHAVSLVGDDSQVTWAPVVEIPADNIIVGGVSTADSGESDVPGTGDYSGLVPVPPPVVSPTVQALLEEMLASVNDFDIISNRLQDPMWSSVFASLSPEDFGSIVAHVNVDFDQPKIASYLAPRINGGHNFTHEYILAALKNAADWNRTAMLTELLPFCANFAEGRPLIMAELTLWEQTVASDALEAALRSSSI